MVFDDFHQVNTPKNKPICGEFSKWVPGSPFVDYFLNVFSVKTIVLVGIYFINNSRGLFFLWSWTSRGVTCIYSMICEYEYI